MPAFFYFSNRIATFVNWLDSTEDDMRKLAAAVALLSLVAFSCDTHRTKADRLVENYAVVKIPAPDLSGITDNGKEVLNLYRFAADEVDKIYWKQHFGDREALLGSIADPSAQL